MRTLNKTEAKKEISGLVNHFDKNISNYKKGGINEAQIENNFIRPLFQCLNWNIDNRGLDPEKQVFLLQVTGKTGTDKNKRPDYLIRIPDKDSNSMKSAFFIEAKIPKYDLKTNTTYIRQVYQYAWSTLNSSESPNNQVRLALLTDFEEFRFFDCQDVTPLQHNRAESFNKHIIKDWTYKEYVSRFDELWDLFEYNNVVNGSLDKWYLTSKQLADNRITPDKLFLEDLRNWRLDIARSMYKNDKTLDDFKLTKATLLYINRIIFVKMLADRNIEPDYLTNILSELNKSKKTELKLYELCKTIFVRLDNIYNGSIFAHDEIADELFIDNSVLKNIFLSLDPEKSIYTLAAMPVEIIGNVYELLIAEQIVKKGGSISIVSRYDEKKAGGVYYTPRYIVEYIVENTLGKKLDECKTPEDVAKIKVLDPACGSGSFLIVAYQKLLDWHKNYYFKELSKWSKKESTDKFRNKNDKKIRVISNSDMNYNTIHLSHKLKSEILVNNIFGVDIDEQAVLVTKFSLSIKSLEDSTHDEVIEDNSLFKIPAIPKLEKNIKCGNSLIGSDFYKDNRPSLFNEKEKRKINTFDWDGKDGFPNIMQSGGFDVVIGNPPYIRNTSLDYVVKDYFDKKYFVSDGQYDIYILFNELSTKLLVKNGLLGFIQPNKFLSADYGQKTLNFIKSNLLISMVYNVSLDKVFKDASVYPYVFIFKKLSFNIKIKLEKIIFNELVKDENLVGFTFNQNQTTIINKIKTKSIKLVEIINKVKRGVPNDKINFTQSGINAIKSTDLSKPYLLQDSQLFINYINNDLKKRYIIEFSKPMIILPRTILRIRAILKNNNNHILDRIYYFDVSNETKYSLKYILACLNSKYINFIYNYFFGSTKIGGGYFDLKGTQINEFLIPKIDFMNKKEKAKHDKLVELVDQMLENQKYQHEARTESDKKMYGNICSSLDNQIDKLVYELYELTEEEIKIVEGE